MPDSPTPIDPNLDPLATVSLKAGMPQDPYGTVRITNASNSLAGLDLPGASPVARRSWLPWVIGGLAAAAVTAGVWIWSTRSTGPTQEVVTLPSPPAAMETLTPEVRALVKEADGGNVHAMRTLALWYYYGLNVSKDREKGLEWYRKAAAAGSSAARQELAQIESGQR
ncbi:MAG: SEL1-like repeat protein [Acidobacteria bacterium]|nr:SEL1-like repeat protein [Acidobacteriota bacterium]